MPVIEFSLSDLQSLLGKEINPEDLEDLLSYVKGELDDFSGDTVKVELKDTNRIDLWCVEGISRELKGILGIEEGIPKYEVSSGKYEVYVSEDLKKIRPYFVGAVVKGVHLGEEGLGSLIQLQEKIMHSFGLMRKRVAIGTHNLDLIEFPVRYTAVKPEEIKFVPLKEETEMNLKEILEKTETGKKYGHLIKDFEKYPIIIDNKGEIISFPPIINSNTIGRLTPETKNIFIDITGPDLKALLLTLNAIVTALADRGGKIESVNVIYSDRKIVTPELKILSKTLDLNKIRKVCGILLSDYDIINLLKKRRFESKIENGKLTISYVNYRDDILSEYDIAEELLIAYGYNRIDPKVPEIYTKGKLTRLREFINDIRELLIGLGSVELHTPVLSSEEVVKALNLKAIKLKNPASKFYNVIRPSLLVSFLQVYKTSKGIPLPAEFFEVGRVLQDTLKESVNALYILVDNEVSFTEIKTKIERLFKELGINYTIGKSKVPFIIEGRGGSIVVDNQELGWIGEIHPKVLERLEINTPIAGFEINLSKLLKIIQ